MPRTNIDYSKTSIYKLCCNDLNIKEIYVGNTTDMRKRKYQHKSCCNNENGKYYNINVYKFIRNNGGFENWDMIEIEKYNATDGYDAKKKERYWIEELKASLNMVIPSRTQKEYIEKNKETINEYKKEYYEINKEIINEKNKKYNEKNKEKRKDYLKIYLENNKEIINKKAKIYRENNKEIINKKQKEIITCECGCEIIKNYLTRHQQSKKHITLLNHLLEPSHQQVV